MGRCNWTSINGILALKAGTPTLTWLHMQRDVPSQFKLSLLRSLHLSCSYTYAYARTHMQAHTQRERAGGDILFVLDHRSVHDGFETDYIWKPFLAHQFTIFQDQSVLQPQTHTHTHTRTHTHTHTHAGNGHTHTVTTKCCLSGHSNLAIHHFSTKSQSHWAEPFP